MFRPALALVILAVSTLAAQATEKPIWRLDSVTAVAVKGGIQVQATGAVKSGGWGHVRLKLTKSGPGTMVLEMLAQPPSGHAVVIQGLLPVSAQVTVKGGSGVVAVRVEAEANDITAQVLH